MIVTDIFSQLTRDEGCVLHVYPDQLGIDTIGIGHNLEANPLPFDVSNGITMEQALQILHDDVDRISAKLFFDLPWLQDLDEVRQGVFINMAFNMGVGGIEKFHHDLADTQAGNYAQAAADMKASKWYTEVGARAQRLCVQMVTGEWQ